MQQPGWLEQAWPETGIREVRGSGSNPRIAALFKDAGHAQIKSDETAWCAAFVGACLARAGIDSTKSLLARSYLKWGEPIDSFRLGAIAVFSRGNDPGQGHVGFVLGESEDKIYLLGGNQSDAVSVEAIDRSRLLGLRWPAVATGNSHEQSDAKVFDRALDHVLEMEGGWTEDPYDPGGPTNQGITLAVYAAWKGITLDATNTGALKDELRRIAGETVREIYLRRYWLPAGCPDLDPGLALMHFDAAVNHGVGTAARTLQEASGATVDGEIGPETRAAIDRASATDLLSRYADIRRARYRALPHFWRFGRGWLRRADLTLERGLAMADPQSRSLSNTTKGYETMQNDTAGQPAPKWWGQSMTIWGAVVTALATVVPVVGPVVGVDITGEVIRQAGGQAVQVFQAVGGLVGTALTIWGRIRATSPLERRDMNIRI